MKWNLFISAIVSDDRGNTSEVEVSRREWHINPLIGGFSVLDRVKEMLPFVCGWQFDDGFDEEDSLYCQYVRYDGYGSGNYILASFYVTED